MQNRKRKEDNFQSVSVKSTKLQVTKNISEWRNWKKFVKVWIIPSFGILINLWYE